MTVRRVFHDRLDSTSLEARRAYTGTPLLVVAAEQSAGMGRLGRTWQSPRGGLWMSLAWPVQGDIRAYRAVPLAVGLAAVEAIEAVCGLQAAIKWPNDVWLDDRKLAGILCQTAHDVLVAGIGINANFPATALPDDLRTPPATLLDALGAPVDLAALEAALTHRLVDVLQACEQNAWEQRVLPAIRKRLCWTGALVQSTDGEGTVLAQGLLRDIDASGALVLDTPSGVRTVAVGELRRVSPDADRADERSAPYRAQ